MIARTRFMHQEGRPGLAGDLGPLTAPSKSGFGFKVDSHEAEDQGVTIPSGVPKRGGDERRPREPQEGDGEVAQRRHHLRARAAPDLGAVLVEGDVPHPVEPVLDGPMGADEREEARRRGLGRREARDPVDGLGARGARREDRRGAAQAEDLSDVGEGEIAVQRGTGPEAPGLQAAVPFIRRAGLRGERRPTGGRRCRRGGSAGCP